DVPPGSRSLTVSLDYDRSAGVLDLGGFDPAGRFRGWSGGARSTFTVTTGHATPGYLPRPISPGAWQVIVGLHRVPPHGLAWTVSAAGRAVGPRGAGPHRAATYAAPVATAPPARTGRPHLARRGPACPHRPLRRGAHRRRAGRARGRRRTGLPRGDRPQHRLAPRRDRPRRRRGRHRAAARPGGDHQPGHANAYGHIGWVDFRRPAADWLSTLDGRAACCRSTTRSVVTVRGSTRCPPATGR